MSEISTALKEFQKTLPAHVTLVAVSKTNPMSLIQEAYDAGQRIFGENRPQELAEKAASMPEDIQWHMIGHLQSNKVKYIIHEVAMIHSIDSLGLLDEIEKRAKKIDRKIDVLLQVHIAKEEQKHGFDEEDLHMISSKKLLERYPHIVVRGLMGMATFTEDEKQIRTEFKSLKNTFDSLKNDRGENFDTLSMGMSGDHKIAIEEGSTMVRIGSSIFGNR